MRALFWQAMGFDDDPSRMQEEKFTLMSGLPVVTAAEPRTELIRFSLGVVVVGAIAIGVMAAAGVRHQAPVSLTRLMTDIIAIFFFHETLELGPRVTTL
jgi:hypothetical protein